jgi:hypothetical protein
MSILGDERESKSSNKPADIDVSRNKTAVTNYSVGESVTQFDRVSESSDSETSDEEKSLENVTKPGSVDIISSYESKNTLMKLVDNSKTNNSRSEGVNS